MSKQKAKDKAGNEVHVGDKVAYVVPRYSRLSIGTIDKINRTGATIDGTSRRFSQIAKIC